MAIDFSGVDKLSHKLERDASTGRWFARTYSDSVVLYEDEVLGFSGGPVPSEMQDVFASQRTAVILGGRQVALSAGTALLAGSTDVLAATGLYPAPAYVTNAYGHPINHAGTTLVYSVLAMAIHDLLAHTTLVNPITGRTNLASINYGQQLVKLSSPDGNGYWWSDPGPITLSENASNMVPSLAGQIEFSSINGSQACVITSPVGYGNGAADKRRTQLNFNPIGRGHYRWELSFMMTAADDAPYDTVTAYGYGFLLWQLKGAEHPALSLQVRTRADGDYDLIFTNRWSSWALDNNTKSYTRVLNGVSGLSNSTGTQTLMTKTFKRGEWVDLVIDAVLDERDINISAVANADAVGYGRATLTMNGVVECQYSGPTLVYKDISGNVPPNPHMWILAIYRHESGSSGTTVELDKTKEIDPAPYQRQVAFRRARVVKLG